MTKRRGSAIIVAIVFLSIILGAAVSLVNYTAISNQATKSIDYYTEAKNIAEAGIEKALWCVKQTVGTNCGGTYGTNYTGESNVPFGSGVFTVTVTPIDINTKKVESTGYIPSATNPKKKVTLRTNIEINSLGVGLYYGLQIGAGGMKLEEHVTITGNVFSNGSIEGEADTNITGDAKVAKIPSLYKDQEWTAKNADLIFGQKDTAEEHLAQSFTVSTTTLVNSISLYIKKISTPSDLDIYLARDNNGEPAADAPKVGTLSAANITTSYQWLQITVSNLPLIAEKTYWLILSPSNPSDTKYYTLGFDNENGYPNGALKTSETKNAGSWTAKNGDGNFAIYLGGVETIIDNIDVGGAASAGSVQNSTVDGTVKTKVLIDDSTIGGNAYSATIKDSTIGGNAYANTVTNSTIGGTQNPGDGLEPPNALDYPFSETQINDWKAGALAGGVQNGDYTTSNSQQATLGPKKINGNMNLGNGTILTLAGVVHVTGNMTIDNGATVKLDSDYASLSGMIIVDGTVHIGENVIFQGSGQAGSYLLIASLSEGGGHHDSAIDIHKSTQGIIFFAPNGLVYLHNNVNLKQVTALKLQIQNNSVITYESGLGDIEFSTGPQAGWAIVPGTFQEIK